MGNPDLVILGDRERTLQTLINHLSQITSERDDATIKISTHLNSPEFASAWKEFCSVYNLQDTEGRCSVENLRAAIALGEEELKKPDDTIGVGLGDIQEIKSFVERIIAISDRKYNDRDVDPLFCTSDELNVLLWEQCAQGVDQFADELLLEHINPDNMGDLNHNVILRLIGLKGEYMHKVLDSYREDNITSISGAIVDKVFDTDVAYVLVLLGNITSENISNIDRTALRTLIMRSEQHQLSNLVSRITSGNLSSFEGDNPGDSLLTKLIEKDKSCATQIATCINKGNISLLHNSTLSTIVRSVSSEVQNDLKSYIDKSNMENFGKHILSILGITRG